MQNTGYSNDATPNVKTVALCGIDVPDEVEEILHVHRLIDVVIEVCDQLRKDRRVGVLTDNCIPVVKRNDVADGRHSDNEISDSIATRTRTIDIRTTHVKVTAMLFAEIVGT